MLRQAVWEVEFDNMQSSSALYITIDRPCIYTIKSQIQIDVWNGVSLYVHNKSSSSVGNRYTSQMDTKAKCKVLFAVLLILVAVILGSLFYKYIKGNNTEVAIAVTEKTIDIKKASEKEKIKIVERDERFDGVLTEIHNGLRKVGNLSYHNHFSNKKHEKDLKEIEQHNKTIRIALIMSSILIITIIIGILGIVIYKYKRNGNTGGTVKDAENHLQTITYGHGRLDAIYNSNPQTVSKHTGQMANGFTNNGGTSHGGSDYGYSRHSRHNRKLPKLPEGEKDFYEITIDPILDLELKRRRIINPTDNQKILWHLIGGYCLKIFNNSLKYFKMMWQSISLINYVNEFSLTSMNVIDNERQ